MKQIVIGLVAVMVSLCAKAQMTNENWLVQTLGIPSGAVANVGVCASYAPSLHRDFKQDIGATVFVDYHTSTNAILGYEIRGQYLNINKYEGTVWQPNGLLSASYKVHWGSVTVTPFVEAGAAVDSKIHPYGIVGSGLALSYGHLFILGGIERWTGPANAFTVYQLGLGWSFNF